MKAKELQELGQWKVGQEVICYERHYRKTCIIKRITDGRGGTIYAGGSSFDADGKIRSSSIWDQARIEILTPEAREEIINRTRRNKLSQFDFSSLPFNQSSEIFLKMKEMGIVI